MLRSILLVLAVSLLTGVLNAQSGLTEAQKEQLKDFEKYIKSKDVSERTSQVGFLEHIDGVEATALLLDRGLTDKELRVRARAVWALCAKHDPEAVKLIKTRGFTSRNPLVREGAVRAVGRMEDEAHEDAIVELINVEKKPLVLIAAFRALARTRSRKAMPIVAPFYAHRHIGVVNAAVYMTGETEDKQYAKPIWGLLSHPRREVQTAALQALGKLRSRESIPFILAFFEDAKGRLQSDCRDCLMAITTRKYGYNPQTWIKWWERVRGRWKVPDAPVVSPADAKYKSDDTPSFHDIKTRSKHIAFVIDVSASMDQTMRYKVRGTRKGPITWRTAKRIDLAKAELTRIVRKLDRNTWFNIVTFEAKTRAFKKSPVRAGPGTIAEAVRWISGIRAWSNSSGSASYTREGWRRGETNTFSALRYIYGFKDGKVTSFTGRLKPIADTVFFLSDGEPTAGYLVVLDEIMDQLERYHPNGQVVIHTIAYDLTGVGRQLMADIAHLTGGRFVEVGAER